MNDRWFAWRPVRLTSSKWAWLRIVHRTRCGNMSRCSEMHRSWWKYAPEPDTVEAQERFIHGLDDIEHKMLTQRSAERTNRLMNPETEALINDVARANMEAKGGCHVRDWQIEARDNPHVALALRQARAALLVALPRWTEEMAGLCLEQAAGDDALRDASRKEKDVTGAAIHSCEAGAARTLAKAIRHHLTQIEAELRSGE
jgi:hypothetical protein